MEWLKRFFVSNCDGGFTYGRRSKRYLLKLGMSEDKITVRCQAAANDDIRRSFDSVAPSRRQLIQKHGLGEKNFCYVGRLSPEKNVSCLIRAFGMLRRDCHEAKNWGLLVVGDGPDRQSLVDLCESQGLRNVTFTGGVPWREAPKLLAACDVFVLPSTSEPWGLVVNEAMVCGLPVLVSDACGCVEDLVFAGETGFVFNPSNPDELRRRMEYFVRSPAEIDRMGANAINHIEKFTPKAAAAQMLQGIERLLGRHEPTASGKLASRV
jgi:glycosyltransferase involved in cell wall biosynthesis